MWEKNKNIRVDLTPGLLEKYQACLNIDELWSVLHDELKQFQITSIFYGLSHTFRVDEAINVGNKIWQMSSHPEAFTDYFEEEYFITHDLSSLHCFAETTPFIWHDKSQWGEPTKEQFQFMMKCFELNMAVGVSLPVHFRQHGRGGLGLCAGNSSEKEFDEIWAENKHEIMTISYLFDELARANHMEEVYSLTERELEVLTWLTLGRPAKGIAGELGISSSTIEKHIRSGRQKLQAKNNEQAITKALVLGLIHP